MSGFVDVVVSATGERTTIPAHWVGNPILFRGFEMYQPPPVEPVVVEPEPAVVVEETPEPPAPAEPPAKSAAKDDWVAFAVYSGEDFAAADAMTKDDLVKKYA